MTDVELIERNHVLIGLADRAIAWRHRTDVGAGFATCICGSRYYREKLEACFVCRSVTELSAAVRRRARTHRDR